MQPEHHEKALVAFFFRHAVVAPIIDADGLIERHGLVLAMAFALREAGFRISTGYNTHGIGRENFTHAELTAAGAEAHMLAHRVEGVIDGAIVEPDGSRIDAMAMAMRRLEQAGLPVTPRALVEEGFASDLVDLYGVEAAQLAEAIKVGIRHWRKAAIRRSSADLAAHEAA